LAKPKLAIPGVKRVDFLNKDSKEMSSNDEVGLLQEPQLPRKREGFCSILFGGKNISKVLGFQSTIITKKQEASTSQKIISLNIPN